MQRVPDFHFARGGGANNDSQRQLSACTVANMRTVLRIRDAVHFGADAASVFIADVLEADAMLQHTVPLLCNCCDSLPSALRWLKCVWFPVCR